MHRFRTSALRGAAECLVCGQPAIIRVDATIADHVAIENATFPLCEAHAAQDRSRFVMATVVGGVGKLAPVTVAYGLGRYIDLALVPMLGLIGLTALGSFAIERAASPRLKPLCKIVGVDDDFVQVVVLGTPPTSLTQGGPPGRGGSGVVDRTQGRVGLAALLGAIALIVGGWQWTQSQPTLWLHNPTPRMASVTIDGEVISLQPSGKHAIRLREGRHTVELATQNQHMELPIQMVWGAPMLLATEPACYRIDLAVATPMVAKGQLFTLGTGDWSPIDCSE